MRPLDGITVLALEHVISAPFCTRQLADLGARVIKIERPGGGDQARGYDQRVRGLSSHFVWTNRCKESLTLDVKHPQAAEVLQRLLERSDVLVQNLAPGAAARMGLSFDALHARFPKLIVCDISGYGDDAERPGPFRDKKAYDLLIQSEAGFLSITGTPDEPAKAGASIADIAAGMYAYSSILAALIQRGRTGRGCRLDVSMLEAMAEWMSFPLYYAYEGAEPPPRAGAAHATIYPYGPFTAGDGKVVMLGLQNEREWKLFCERVLQQPALASDERFASNPQARGGSRGAARARSSRCSPRSRPSRSSSGSKPHRSPMHASTTCTRCGSTRSCTRANGSPRCRRPPARWPRCGRRRCRHRSRRAWMRCLRSASTPTRCWPSLAFDRDAIAGFHRSGVV